MNTVILFWNPTISNYKLENFQKEMEEAVDLPEMNWSVWEHEKAHSGDRFFMVRCGDGNTGICMSGYFSSNPYKGEDWSGRGRVTYYMNLDPDYMINSDYRPILKTSSLIDAIPEFDWTGGHSGRLLEPALAEKLEKLWSDFTTEHSEMFTLRALHREVDPEDFRYVDNKKVTVYLSVTDEGKINAYCRTMDIDIDGDDIDDAKKRVSDCIFKKIGGNVQIQFSYDDYIDDEETLLYEKTIRIVLENKKPGMTFDRTYWEFEEKIVYLLYKVDVSPALLRNQEFRADIVDAIDALKRKDGESVMEYVKRAVKNETSKEILRDEIYVGLDIRDRKVLNKEDLDRLNEYLAAYAYIESLEDD